MSTQKVKPGEIPFHLTEPLENIRLLEVPDDLLDIIENTQQEIYLRSAPVIVGNGVSSLSGVSKGDVAGEGRQGNVHLCTNEKVWAVKQVSTSNSIYVTRTCEVQGESNGDVRDGSGADDTKEQDKDVNMEDSNPSKSNEEVQDTAKPADKASNKDKGPSTGISAYAKPTSVLELLALPATTYENTVLEHLRALPHYSLSELHEHIPAPTKIIQRVLAQKCVFEVHRKERSRNASSSASNSDSRSARANQSKELRPDENATITTRTYIPSSSLLLSTWNEIVQVATLTDTSITGPENADILSHDVNAAAADQSLRSTNGKKNDSMDLDVDDQRQRQTFHIPSDATTDETNKIIQQIIAKRMFEKDGYFAAIGIMTSFPSPNNGSENATTNNMKINSRECTRWVGNLILSATTEDGEEHQQSRQPKYTTLDLLERIPSHNLGRNPNTNQISPGKGLSKITFESKWENSVPASWIKFCSVEVLRGACEVYTLTDTDTDTNLLGSNPTQNGQDDDSLLMVRWTPYTLESETDTTTTSSLTGTGIPGSQRANINGSKAGAAGGSAASTKNKRKWHEKFAAQRNVKK